MVDFWVSCALFSSFSVASPHLTYSLVSILRGSFQVVQLQFWTLCSGPFSLLYAVPLYIFVPLNFNSIEKQPMMAISQVYFSALSQSATSRSLASYSALKKGCFTGFSPLYAPPRRHFVVYVFECTVKQQDGHPDVSAKIYYLDSMHSTGGHLACVKQEQEFPGYVFNSQS